MINWQLWIMFPVNHKVIAWLYSQALPMKLIAQLMALLFVPTVMTVMLAQVLDSLPTGSEKLVRTEYLEMK